MRPDGRHLGKNLSVRLAHSHAHFCGPRIITPSIRACPPTLVLKQQAFFIFVVQSDFLSADDASINYPLPAQRPDSVHGARAGPRRRESVSNPRRAAAGGAPDGAGRLYRGRRTVTVVPRPTSLWMSTLPSSAVTISSTTASPIPLPRTAPFPLKKLHLDVFQIVRRNAPPFIRDIDESAVAVGQHVHTYSAVGRRIFDGVVQNVDEHRRSRAGPPSPASALRVRHTQDAGPPAPRGAPP